MGPAKFKDPAAGVAVQKSASLFVNEGAGLRYELRNQDTGVKIIRLLRGDPNPPQGSIAQYMHAFHARTGPSLGWNAAGPFSGLVQSVHAGRF